MKQPLDSSQYTALKTQRQVGIFEYDEYDKYHPLSDGNPWLPLLGVTGWSWSGWLLNLRSNL